MVENRSIKAGTKDDLTNILPPILPKFYNYTMPTISSSDKVLVTGANGYIALWIVKVLLERGNSVRAAVRSESKARILREQFSSYGEKLETVLVPDMTKVCTLCLP